MARVLFTRGVTVAGRRTWRVAPDHDSPDALHDTSRGVVLEPDDGLTDNERCIVNLAELFREVRAGRKVRPAIPTVCADVMNLWRDTPTTGAKIADAERKARQRKPDGAVPMVARPLLAAWAQRAIELRTMAAFFPRALRPEGSRTGR